jgi:hypothetical protein
MIAPSVRMNTSLHLLALSSPGAGLEQSRHAVDIGLLDAALADVADAGAAVNVVLRRPEPGGARLA